MLLQRRIRAESWRLGRPAEGLRASAGFSVLLATLLGGCVGEKSTASDTASLDTSGTAGEATTGASSDDGTTDDGGTTSGDGSSTTEGGTTAASTVGSSTGAVEYCPLNEAQGVDLSIDAPTVLPDEKTAELDATCTLVSGQGSFVELLCTDSEAVEHTVSLEVEAFPELDLGMLPDVMGVHIYRGYTVVNKVVTVQAVLRGAADEILFAFNNTYEGSGQDWSRLGPLGIELIDGGCPMEPLDCRHCRPDPLSITTASGSVEIDEGASASLPGGYQAVVARARTCTEPPEQCIDTPVHFDEVRFAIAADAVVE